MAKKNARQKPAPAKVNPELRRLIDNRRIIQQQLHQQQRIKELARQLRGALERADRSVLGLLNDLAYRVGLSTVTTEELEKQQRRIRELEAKLEASRPRDGRAAQTEASDETLAVR